MGIDGGYTERDIKEVARVFTGWSIWLPGAQERRRKSADTHMLHAYAERK